MTFKVSRRSFTKAMAGLVAFIPAVRELVQPAVALACTPPCCAQCQTCYLVQKNCIMGTWSYGYNCYCCGGVEAFCQSFVNDSSDPC